MPDDGIYTTKDMFEKIDRKLDELAISLEKKADRERVHELANAITHAEIRIMAAITPLDTRATRLEVASSNERERMDAIERKVSMLSGRLLGAIITFALAMVGFAFTILAATRGIR